MPTINVSEYHSLNRILEIRNLSDAKYYVFILLLSEMKDDAALRSNHLDIVQHAPNIIDSAKRITMDIYGLGKDFEYLKNNGPHSFRYLAKNVDTYLVQVSDDEYELRIPHNITILINKEDN